MPDHGFDLAEGAHPVEVYPDPDSFDRVEVFIATGGVEDHSV